jgi:hypothetical protein
MQGNASQKAKLRDKELYPMREGIYSKNSVLWTKVLLQELRYDGA